MNMLKLLLGVRLSTCNDLVLVETGFPSAKDFVKDKQLKFLEKLQNRLHFKDSYIKFMLDLAVHKGSPMGKYISNLQHEQPVTCFFTMCKYQHVLLFCPKTEVLRNNSVYAKSCSSIYDFFDQVNSYNVADICKYCEKVLKMYY